ncbi:hypothetical protein [Devosia nitrariae]|uniref:Predicted 3'-5' exonuclease PolB-like domain-containing protein n=1 Tax=Devosia nitrariae TaxID=2071872 RepID=A0ABQ5W145_9HYPH|nr:hypothetical protein [Devosia nitrariae]GLQ53617.1 hypothetical protein GCM10010862_08760 [Devosia nitrariae]
MHSFSHYDALARQAATALYLYVDIETIPSQDATLIDAIRAKHNVAEPQLDAIEPDRRLKDPEKIADDLARKREKAVADNSTAIEKAEAAIEEEYRRTALDASTGHIACACVAVGTGDIYDATISCAAQFIEDAERDMLNELFGGLEQLLQDHARNAALKSLDAQGRDNTESLKLEIQRHRVVPVVVAHHAGFDIRYIWQRAIVLGVTPPSWWPVDARPWDTDRVADTMTMWAGHGNRIGLDRLCKALGLPGKQGVDGSQVWDLVRAGRINEVVSYCDDDVRRLRSVHRKMLGLPQLEIDEIEVPAEGADGEREAA